MLSLLRKHHTCSNPAVFTCPTFPPFLFAAWAQLYLEKSPFLHCIECWWDFQSGCPACPLMTWFRLSSPATCLLGGKIQGKWGGLISHLCVDSVLSKTPLSINSFMSLSCSLSSFHFICIVSVRFKRNVLTKERLFRRITIREGAVEKRLLH